MNLVHFKKENTRLQKKTMMGCNRIILGKRFVGVQAIGVARGGTGGGGAIAPKNLRFAEQQNPNILGFVFNRIAHL